MTVVEEVTLRELSQELSNEWEPLASFLGLKAVDIRIIKMDIPGQTENQVFNMLVKWRQMQSSGVDQIALLCAGLDRAHRMDLSDQLRGGPRPPVSSHPQDASGKESGDTEGKPTDFDLLSNTGCGHQSTPQQRRRSPSPQPKIAAVEKETKCHATNSTPTEVHETNLKESEGKTGCSKHSGEALDLLCETCKEVICRECADGNHRKPKHHCVSCESASEKYKQIIQNKIPVLNVEIEGIQKCLAESSQYETAFKTKVTQTIKEVQERAAKIIEEVKAGETRLIEEIRKLEHDRNNAFHVQEKRTTVILRRKQYALRTAKDVVQIKPHSEFMSQYLMVSQVMDITGQHHSTTDRKLSYLNFEESHRVGDISLGRLELGGRWELRREFGSRGSGQGEFQMAKSIAARQAGEIEVADFINKRVVVFSHDGDVVRSISTEGAPRDIAALRTQLVVVDDGSHAQMYNKTNMAAAIVGKKKCDFRSVAIKKDGTVIVGDVGKNLLTEHNRHDGSLRRTVSVKTKPYFMAVYGHNVFRERVVISGGFQKQVDIVDSEGAAISCIRPRIEGQEVYQCTGVCCDSAGIYVAINTCDRNTGHIHQYDAEGAFLACVARGLHNPQGIAFTADGHQLAVADTYSVKMYHKV